ncbi:hypothetical protein [Burkholderia multivorans]|uniref:glycine-rich domain-containing protein n=1 Tax=Burkholderia multivorans TaxID=87883 RepID=UPI0021C20A91|nr:hypothetical protein [Burkholderia multivorans]
MKKILISALLALTAAAHAATKVPVQMLDTTGSTAGQVVVSGGAAVAPSWGSVPLGGITSVPANTVLANATGVSATPAAFPMPSCSGANNALRWTSGTGFTCASGIALTTSGINQFAATTSAQLASVISDETGTGALVFANGPALTGVPTAPTASAGTNTTQIATTAFVANSYAPLASPTFTGTTTVSNLTATGTLTGITGRLVGVQVFTTANCNPSCTYTPTAGTGRVVAKVMGAGGAGGGCPATTASTVAIGGGGGAGAYAQGLVTSGYSGVTVTVGQGGTGVSGSTGNSGGNSSFGALITATGGSGGSASAAAAAPNQASGGNGNGSSGGQLNGTAQPGALGLASSLGVFYSGSGGSTAFGRGAPGTTGTGAGIAGGPYGGGGGGAGCGASAAAQTGGRGGDGFVEVDEYQ